MYNTSVSKSGAFILSWAIGTSTSVLPPSFLFFFPPLSLSLFSPFPFLFRGFCHNLVRRSGEHCKLLEWGVGPPSWEIVSLKNCYDGSLLRTKLRQLCQISSWRAKSLPILTFWWLTCSSVYTVLTPQLRISYVSTMRVYVCSVSLFLAAAGDVVDRVVEVPEPYTAVRLVSSGWSYNSVSIRYQQLPAASDYEWRPTADCCGHCEMTFRVVPSFTCHLTKIKMWHNRQCVVYVAGTRMLTVSMN